MGERNEYAKLVKINTNDSTKKGFKATITLPTYKELPVTDDYINFYCGLGTFECGISTKNRPEFLQNDVLKWHWFANTKDGIKKSDPLFYSDGTTIPISLERDANDHIVFKVNGTAVYTSKYTFTYYSNLYHDQTNPARLILAACQNSTITNPLPAWRIKHYQVVAASMKYKNSAGSWVSMTDVNKVVKAHWPTNITPPAPVDYTVDTRY